MTVGEEACPLESDTLTPGAGDYLLRLRARFNLRQRQSLTVEGKHIKEFTWPMIDSKDQKEDSNIGD